MKTRILLTRLLCICLYTSAYSQLTKSEEELLAPSLSSGKEDHLLEFNIQAFPSSGEKLPFWMYHNRRGRVSERSHVAAWLSGKSVTFLTDRHHLILGGGILYRDGINEGALADELYAHYQDPSIFLTLGRKQRPESFNGLSASGESVLWSLNARPLPGIQFGTAKPLFLFSQKRIGIEGSWNEYFTGEDEYVEGTRIHHKKLHMIFRGSEWEIKTGVQHFAQWAGNSPKTGQQPNDFPNYLKVWTGREGTVQEEGSRLNIIGNHLSSYELFVKKYFQDFEVMFLYNHISDDISGRHLKNIPDGRYGIYYKNDEEDKLINSFMYEFYYTKHQSYTASGFHKHDNYFNNGTYKSGWTYRNRVLGSPFFTIDPEEKGIINNKFTAHHFGIRGQIGDYFKSYPYRMLLSYAHNEGRYNSRFQPKQDVFYGLFDLLLLQNVVRLNLQVALELNSYTAPVYGAGMNLFYRL